VKYAQCVKNWTFVSEVHAVSEVLCSVFDGHSMNLAIVQFLMKKKGDTQYMGVSPISIKGRRTLWGRISYLNKREMHVKGACLPFT
jgi:hypothetical protein